MEGFESGTTAFVAFIATISAGELRTFGRDTPHPASREFHVVIDRITVVVLVDI
jgi:hypothetical protein